MMRLRKWLVAIPFIFVFVLGLPSLITGRWGWFLVDRWATAFLVLWTTIWIAGTFFYRPARHRRVPDFTRLVFSLSAVVVPLLAFHDRVNGLAENRSTLWPAAGLALYLTGAALDLYAWRALNRWYAPDPAILPGQKLVTSGPYRLVRHPMYSAILLALSSLPLLLRSLLDLGLSVLLVLPGLWLRIREEEALLLDEFGDEYQACIN